MSLETMELVLMLFKVEMKVGIHQEILQIIVKVMNLDPLTQYH